MTTAHRSSRHDPRYPVQKPETVMVRLQRVGEPADQPIAARLRDISLSGAQLVCGEAIPTQTAVCVTLQTADGSFSMAIDAAVCWTLPEPKQRWSLGCRFEPALPQMVLESLFTSKVIERRMFYRAPVRLPARVQWELSKNAGEALVLDLSEGGFCMLVDRRNKPGARMLVIVEHEGQLAEVPARLQWEVSTASGVLVGCEFINKHGCLAMTSIQHRSHAAEATPARTRSLRRLVDRLLKR